MFEIKLAARKMLRGKTLWFWLLSICPYLLILCATISAAYPLMGIFTGSAALFDDIEALRKYPCAGKGVLIFLFAESIFFIICSAGVKLYSEAKIFYLLDKNQTRPKRFLCFSQSVRFLQYKIRVFALKSLWALLFFAPAAAVSHFLAFHMLFKPVMKRIFVVLTILFCMLLLLGRLFFVAASTRYYMCAYLLYLNPLQSVKEVVRSSILLTKGKIKKIILLRLSALPWALCSLTIIALPFCISYLKGVKAVACERLYGEEKTKSRLSAVTFYINEASRFSAKT